MALVIKSADEVIASDNTLGDDSELVIALAANTLYRVEGFIRWYSGTTPAFKYLWHYTGTIVWADVTDLRNAFPVVNSNFSTGGANMEQDCYAADYLMNGASRSIVGATTTTNRAFIWLLGFVRTNTSGNFSFQWAQSTSTASNTTVYGVSGVNGGSYLYIMPVTDVGAA